MSFFIEASPVKQRCSAFSTTIKHAMYSCSVQLLNPSRHKHTVGSPITQGATLGPGLLINTWRPLLLTLISARISNYTHYKMWDEITHPYPNFNGATIKVWEWISNFIPQSVTLYWVNKWVIKFSTFFSHQGPCNPELYTRWGHS